MSDLAMCTRSDCGLRLYCLRYRAVPDPGRQAYVAPDRSGPWCGLMVGVRPGDRVREVEVVDTEREERRQ